MNRIMCSRRRPLGGILVALAFAACANFSCFAQEAPPAAGAAVAAAAGAAVPGAPVPAVPPVAAAVVPARREEVDGAARPSLGDRVRAFANRDGTAGLQAQLRTVTGERDTLRASFDALAIERDALRAERDGLQAQVREVENALTAQGNVVQQTARAIESTVGIPAAALPAPNASGTGEDGGDLDEIRNQMKAETDPRKKAVLARQARVLRMGALV